MSRFIYLDSNDFSDLSFPPDQLRPSDVVILGKLREARATGSVIIPLSPPLLSEAVHANQSSKQSSVRRANLMNELCGSYRLPYPTTICEREIKAALSGTSSTPLTLHDFMSNENDFFGHPFELTSVKNARSRAQQALDRHLSALPRAERRKQKSQLNLSKARSKPLLKQLFKERPWQPSTEFPLNLLDQTLFQDWLVGEKTDLDLDRHLRSILSNPLVLFHCLDDEESFREQLYNLLRRSGAKFSEQLEALGFKLMELHNLSIQANESINARALVDHFINDRMKREFVDTLSEQPIHHLNDSEILELVRRCPSVSALMHVLAEYFHTLMQSNLTKFKNGKPPTKPKSSDFGDFVHLLYAPYVDIFRCDARFGDHLKGHKPLAGKVAARRADILDMLS